MIGMMYLVLTALLALNVSKEILQAFIVVNESIETTTDNFTKKLDDNYTEFEKAYAASPDKVKEFYDKAQEAKRIAQQMVDYIELTKWEVIVSTDNNIETIEDAQNTPLQEIAARDKYTEPTRFFFERSPNGENARSGELRDKIVQFKTDMLELVDPRYRDVIELGLDVDGPFYDADGQPQTWMQHNFYYSILAADITILNKLINEVRNAEFDVTKHLFGAVNADDFKFDKVTAKVLASSNYVLKGDNYEADVIVAAWDSKQNPTLKYVLGADTIQDPSNMPNAIEVAGEGGIAKISIPASTLGIQKFAGVIMVQSPSGVEVPYHFESEYIVGEPSLTVSALKMNVFYIGVDNPVAISVPGIPAERLRPSITTGTMRPQAGNYVVTVPRDARTTTINVSADFDGEMRSMGNAEFRVKRVPDPIATVAGKSSGLVPKAALTAAGGVIPQMPADFEFELFFEIQSFTFVTVRGGDVFERNTRGNRFSPEMKDLIDNARRGTKIWIENIIASGPDGNRQLGTIALQIQ